MAELEGESENVRLSSQKSPFGMLPMRSKRDNIKAYDISLCKLTSSHLARNILGPMAGLRGENLNGWLSRSNSPVSCSY